MLQSAVDYKNLLDTLEALIYGVNAQGHITYANKSFLSFIGIDEDKLIGKPFWKQATNAHEIEKAFELQLSQKKEKAVYWLKFNKKLALKQTISFSFSEKENLQGSVVASIIAPTKIDSKDQPFDLTNYILNSMSESVAVYNTEGQLIKVNSAGKKMFGFDLKTPVKEITSSSINILHPDKETPLSMEEHPKYRVLNGEYIDNYELYVINNITKKGIFISVNARPVTDTDGTVIGAIIVGSNITHRKNSEFEARKQSDLLDQAQKMAQIGHWEVDLQTQEIFWSSQTRKIHEVDEDYVPTLEEAVNFYDSESLPIISKTIEECVKTGDSWDLKLGIISAKGNYKYIRTIGQPVIQNNTAIKLYGVFQDISHDRKREEQLIAFVDAAPAAIAMFDTDMKYIAASDKWYKNYKLSDKKIIGLSHYEIFPEIGEEWKLTHQKALAGEICKAEEDRFERHDGSIQWLKWEVRPWYDLSGKIGGIIMLTEDITLEKLHKEELKNAKEAAELAAQAKEEFLSTMSHEIRTPMNAVIGMTHLLLQEEKLPHQEENLKTLQFSAENLLVLINDILDFNKITAGKITLETVPFNLKELANNIRKSFQFKAQEKQIRLAFIYDNDIPESLIGDTTRINQILVNLVGNAVKFTSEGTVRITIQLLKDAQDEATISFSIKDTGIGIPEEYQANIFERFTQAEKETTRKFGGTGLGLAITKKLLELHHSDIELISKVNQGSEFRFNITFPKAKKDLVTNSPKTENVKELANLKILLVEDNVVNQLIATKFLENWQITVEVADDGQQAIEKLTTNTYNLVLMDLQMPVLDGYEATQEIRKNSAYDQLPIIALTADATTNIKEKVMKVGMNDFLTKPINPEELKSKIMLHAVEKAGAVAHPSKESAKSEITEDTIDFTLIYQMAQNDTTFVITLIESFNKELKMFYDDFRNAANESNTNEMHRLIHKLKPSFELFSLDKLLTKLRETTKKVEENEISDLNSEIQEIEDSTQATLTTLEVKIKELKHSV
ncbi:PAS domain-containing hybrid sensor histidine kinase/response regulator [Fulvivirga sediminis]|uniref:Sensory/regulatory protein RpfC n=1 Tax=Fulvivirga sediminis TaxID=2803949 RepID=A0A937F8K7_9BACT|nr:PAS domain S-box protein [Fulvivirga sediminis]MBL3656594.1 PAS domain S-box protein [Fulvivirga sediminis]